jgi:hypothetical protein
MPLSSNLLSYLKKGRFPLLATEGFRLWEELVSALEKDPAGTTAEAKKEMMDNIKTTEDTIYDPNLSVNGVDLLVGLSDVAMFMGAAHTVLTANFTNANRANSPIQGFIQRIRAKALALGLVEESGVTLSPVDGGHKMGTGLVTTSALTCIPDPSLGPHRYGSQPNTDEIGRVAPPWEKLKRRVYEKSVAGVITYMKKPHYVLAHLINHNINGSGSDANNVAPFYAAANTEMSNHVEKYLTELVQRCVPVHYTIVAGPAVGMTEGRKLALANCETELQREIIEIEQHLAAYLTITLKAQNDKGEWVTIVNARQIDNYVPETVPLV